MFILNDLTIENFKRADVVRLQNPFKNNIKKEIHFLTLYLKSPVK